MFGEGGEGAGGAVDGGVADGEDGEEDCGVEDGGEDGDCVWGLEEWGCEGEGGREEMYWMRWLLLGRRGMLLRLRRRCRLTVICFASACVSFFETNSLWFKPQS